MWLEDEIGLVTYVEEWLGCSIFVQVYLVRVSQSFGRHDVDSPVAGWRFCFLCWGEELLLTFTESQSMGKERSSKEE